MVGFHGKALDNLLGNLGKKPLISLAVPLTKDILSKLRTKANLSVLYQFEIKISGQGPIRAAKRFNLFISNEDMDQIIIIVESLEIRSIN